MDKLEESFDGTFTENIRSQAYKSQASSRKNRLVVNVADTQYAVVKHVTHKNKCFLQTEPISNLSFDLCWTDNHVRPDLFSRMQFNQKINHFPGMAILSRKNNLGTNLMLFRRQFPAEYEFFPITWSLPNDYADLQSYHECRQQGKAQTFIVKPEASCQGRGIYLTRHIDKIKYERCVVQRYMHKPYLIDGLKFDLRIYVLVAGIDPLRIFVYEEGLARFATEEYRPPRSENLDNKFMHLTNYAINKESPNFIFNDSLQNMDIGHKRSLTSVYRKIAQAGHDVDSLKQRINDIFIKTILTGYPTLSQTLTSIHPDNFANDMCFEILGFDIMLDHKLNPYLLEINYTPSFTADTPLDRYIKKNLIADTLQLLNVTEKWKKEARSRREKEIQERMVSGKRRKFTVEQRKKMMVQQARKRDEFESKNMGRFTKIFLKNEEQLEEYKKYYDFAMEIYQACPKLDNNFMANNFSQVRSKKQEFIPYLHYYEKKKQSKDGKDKLRVELMSGKCDTRGGQGDTRDTRNNREGKDDRDYSKESEKERTDKSSYKGRQNRVKKNYHMLSNGKQNDAISFLSRSGQGHFSLATGTSNQRVSSAKGRKERREKRVVYDRVASKKSLKIQHQPAFQLDIDDSPSEYNPSLFQNKNLQLLISKQRDTEVFNDQDAFTDFD